VKALLVFSTCVLFCLLVMTRNAPGQAGWACNMFLGCDNSCYPSSGTCAVGTPYSSEQSFLTYVWTCVPVMGPGCSMNQNLPYCQYAGYSNMLCQNPVCVWVESANQCN
jgi:hypothetical protein